MSAFCLALPATPAFAAADPLPIASFARTLPASEREIAVFYREQAGRPLWVEHGQLRPAAGRVLELINGAAADGLDPFTYRPRELASAVRAAASGRPADLARAELLLSRAVSAYARDLRRPSSSEMHYVDHELRPQMPSHNAVLQTLAAAPSVEAGLDKAIRVNPLYDQLRAAYLAQRDSLSRQEESRILASLERLRALPADLGRRFILVDAASAKLWMYENGRPVGQMKVVVGRPGEPTPMLAAQIRHLALNPYWNVPPDLVSRTIAPNVLDHGTSYLRKAGYEVLSDWSENPDPRDPETVDWAAVAEGREELPVRQLPGPRNSMGKMKFMFPNQLGVYLHDTPNRELFGEDDRRRSAGCVRLEDAPKLARWLFGRTVKAGSKAPEQVVPLDDRVPVYITYLTAMPQGDRIAFHDDIYSRDGELLAGLGGRSHISSR